MKTRKSTPTIKDVALMAGVSTATVSRIINGIEVVHEDTVNRVQAAISELNYIPSSAARVLARRKTNAIGLLVPEISGVFFQSMLCGIEKGSSEAGYDLLIHTTQNPFSKGIRRRPLAEHNTDGLLVFTDSVDPDELNRLEKNNFPVVLLHQTSPEGLHFPSVTVENLSGARQVVDHLIEIHHCQRILFLQGPKNHEDSFWREKGYRESLQSHAIPFDPALIRHGGFNRQLAQVTMEQVLHSGISFDAVFAGDDDASIGVYLSLREAGFRIPEDIAVVGFDDQLFATALTPPLTTVRAPTEQVGLEAVRLLIHRINGEATEPRLVLDTEMVIRQSCGCPLV